VLAKTTRSTPKSRAASSTWNVPSTLTRIEADGLCSAAADSIEPRWKRRCGAHAFTASRTSEKTARSPRTNRAPAGVSPRGGAMSNAVTSSPRAASRAASAAPM
jgi:hypothetical protein